MKTKPKRSKKCAPSATERHRRIIQRAVQSKNDRILAENHLPLGHPINRHKIDITFNPVDALLDSIISTGEVDEDTTGQVVFYDKLDECWYPLVPGLISMCDTFSKLAKEFSWHDQTGGIRTFAKLLDKDAEVNQSHIKAARETVLWMRDRIGLVTPTQFSAEAVEVQIQRELDMRMAA